MSKKVSNDEVNINYPIPKELHRRIKMLSAIQDITLQNILIISLEEYCDKFNGDGH